MELLDPPWILMWMAFLVPLLMLMPYFALPVLIKFTQTQRAEPRLLPFDPRENPPPPGVAEFFSRNIGEMKGLGFSVAMYVALPEQEPNVHLVMVVLENRATDEAGTVVMMYACDQTGMVNVQNNFIQFSTRFSDGCTLSVQNASQPDVFPAVPHRIVYQMPEVQDVQRLYRVFQAAVTGSRKVKSSMPPQGELLEVLKKVLLRELADAEGNGYMYLDPAGEYYRPTWKGAYLMCWKLLFPLKHLRRAAQARRNRRLLEEWGL